MVKSKFFKVTMKGQYAEDKGIKSYMLSTNEYRLNAVIKSKKAKLKVRRLEGKLLVLVLRMADIENIELIECNN